MARRNIWILVGFMMILAVSPVMAMGDRPNPKRPGSRPPEAAPQPAKQPSPPNGATTSAPSSDPTPSVSADTNKNPSANAVLNDDDLADLEKTFKEQYIQKQFADALVTLDRIPVAQQDAKKKALRPQLALFKQVELEAVKANSVFKRDQDVDESVKKTTQKLYREAQQAFIENKSDLSRDLLIQCLFLNRQDAKAKKLLELGLSLKVGDYKVEDIEDKYWNKSSVQFYGGNYSGAIEALNVLVFFDKENPLIYERMGSTYYMMGEKKKAIDSWGTAMFFNPKNKDLQVVLDRARKSLDEDAAESKQKSQTKKKSETAAVADADLQLMGMYKSSNDAYNFAAELKKRGLETFVEEQDNGKWTVKVPKAQLQKK